jgi:hypothetical protein
MRRQRIRKKFASEKRLCDNLISEAEKRNFIAYPEQGNWDIVLVRNKIQIGVQAKLRPNLKVLAQTLG